MNTKGKSKIKILVSVVFIAALTMLTACTATPETDKGFFRVTFDLQGGTGNAPVQLVKEGEKAARYATDPVYTGKYFLGWSSESADFAEFSFDSAITKDTTVYAFWADELFEVIGNSYKWSYSIDVTEEYLEELGSLSITLNQGTNMGMLYIYEEETTISYEYDAKTKELSVWSIDEEDDIYLSGIWDGDVITVLIDGDYIEIITLRLAEGSTDTYEFESVFLYPGLDFTLDFKTDGNVTLKQYFDSELDETINGTYTLTDDLVVVTFEDVFENNNIIHMTLSGNSTRLTVLFDKGELPLLEWLEEELETEITSMVFEKTN